MYVCLGIQPYCFTAKGLGSADPRPSPPSPKSPVPKPCRAFDSWMSWGTNPLYVLLHESIYCQGAASNWAAHRVREQHYAAEFDAVAAARAGEGRG